jgi:hypothetical protein
MKKYRDIGKIHSCRLSYRAVDAGKAEVYNKTEFNKLLQLHINQFSQKIYVREMY